MNTPDIITRLNAAANIMREHAQYTDDELSHNGEGLEEPPHEIILCDENHCFCDKTDEYGDSVCKHDPTQNTAAP